MEEKLIQNIKDDFNAFKNTKSWFREKEITELGEDLIQVLKSKKELSYSDAYAALQYVHDKLKYESNFVQIQSVHIPVDPTQPHSNKS